MKIFAYSGYIVILLVSIWAILNPRVPTKIGGTLGISGMALASFLSIVEPATYNATIDPSELMLVLSVAGVSLWFFIYWVRKK